MSEISLALFHKTSPYDEFDPAPYPPDTQGWHSNDSWFEQIITERMPRTICEVGTWKGASALHMASICRRLDLKSKIVCIDTFLGSPEHWLNSQWYSWLQHKNGFPQLYYTFLSNVVRNHYEDCIIPLPLDAESAAILLKHHGLKFDLIYLDGGHEYASVLRDLQAFWPLVAEDGILLGDDYISWNGVTQAANRFALDNKLVIRGKINKFALTRGGALTLVT
jgi:predicted O-methyltransferase YrrM